MTPQLQDTSEVASKQGWLYYESWAGVVHICPLFAVEPQHVIHQSCWCEPERVSGELPLTWMHRRVQ
jgi:hypothetical protein